MAFLTKTNKTLETESKAQEFALENSVSLGVDIVDISRMRTILERTPSFSKRVFSQDEQAYCNSSATPESHYASRFAAKEAVLKALGTGFSQGIGPKDVEVRLNAKGKPRVVLKHQAAAIAKEKGIIDFPLSLSHTHTEAVAIAMAITSDVVNAEEKRVNPVDELARQFKEARLVLDDIGTVKKEQKPEQFSIDFGNE